MDSADTSPFHDGEIEIQKLVGVREQIEVQGRKYIRSYMPDQFKELFCSLPFVMVGGVDPNTEQPWASLFVGQPGFMSSTSPTRLTIRPAEQQLAGDPIAACIRVGQPLGFLGIELRTRRRNRMNGRIISTGGGAIEIEVDQTFGNCPQYIQAREVYALDGARAPPAASDDIPDSLAQSTHGTVQGRLSQQARYIIDAADTLFIASSSVTFADGPRWGADVSHRGGRPGFVLTEEIKDASSPESGSLTRISFPDFLGNFQFQTLGNILRDPRCGLLFWDFATGHILQMTGKGEILWTGDEIKAFTGAQRVVRFVVEEWVLREGALARFLHVDPSVQWSPTLSTTGVWKEALAALEAERDKTTFRAFEVYQVVKESSTITSFYLRPQDKSQALVVYEAGQFLPIRVMVPCHASGPTPCVDCPPDGRPTSTHKPHTLRFYSLSDRPTGQYYRISVRRHTQGKVSRFLHDVVLPGAFIEAQAPRGSFTLKQKEVNKPTVFLSAGVGCTPFVAMLQYHLGPIARTKDHRPMIYIHGSRNGAEHAFKEELKQLQRLHGNLKVYTCYSQPLATDRRGDSFDHEGRVDIDTVQTFLATYNIEIAQADYYLCGPEPFIDEIYVGLRRAGAPKGSVMYEHFESNWSAKGKKDVIREFELALRSQLRASASLNATPTSTAAAGVNDVIIHFKRSDRSVVWLGGDGEDAPLSLLEAAEQEGLMPPYSCRAGVCGTCALPVLAGEVEYRQDPFADMLPGHALMCCAVPRKGQEGQRIVIDF